MKIMFQITMKTLLLILPLLASVSASGYYYQESSSRSSSSSYKNNELQHQTEDESYYSKHGDTGGQKAPKVNTYSQHLEYKNPRNNEYSDNLGQNRQTQDSDAYAARQAVGSDGIVRTVSGNRDHYAYHATYGVSGGDITPLTGGSYDVQSNLLSMTQRLQNDLSRQLQNAITTQKNYQSSYGSNVYVESEFRNLETELKANLSRQLQEELQRQYGSQDSRGSHSYSIKNGRYSAQANYNTQELEDLKSQLERNLLQQLRNQYQNTQSSSSSSSYYESAGQGSRAHTTMYRPNYPQETVTLTFPLNPEVRPSIPLTDVVTQVQSTVDRKLNEALDETENQYVSGQEVSYREAPNFDTILESLKEELKRNLTATLQDTLVEYYGQQEEHNDYYYSSRNVASGSKVANYKTGDLDSLKQQVLNNLIQKLGNTIQQQRQAYQTNRQSYFQQQQTHETHSSGAQYRPSHRIYTSHVVFQPTSVDQVRPAYRPVTTQVEDRPIRYGTYPQRPSSGSYHQSSSQNQDSQRAEQLEYDYSPASPQGPTGSRPSTGTYRPSGSGTYQTGTVFYPSGSSRFPSSSTYPSGSGGSYPSASGSYPSASGSYPSGSGSSNYQTSQSNRESSYKIAAGHREGGIEYTQPSQRPQTEYQAELINIRDQVQGDISRQLNTAIEKQRHDSSSYASTAVSNNQILNELSEELKTNVTRKVEEALREHSRRNGVRGGYSVTFSTSGNINPGNYNREQLTAMMNQLQEDLLRQLREGLAQDSHRQSSSYTSTGTNYAPSSHGSYGQGSGSYRTYSSGSSYRQRQSYSSGSGSQGECCMQGDDSTTVAQETVEQKNKRGPARGDLGKHDQDTQKIESDEQVDIEAVPPENIQSTTPRLARDKPSRKPTPKPIRQQEQVPDTEEQITQTHQQNIEDSEQQLVEDLSQQSNWDQENLEQNFEQLTDQNHQTDQETEDQFHQQSSGITQQTVDQFSQNPEELEQVFEDQNTGRGITQHSTYLHPQMENQQTTGGRIVQSSQTEQNSHHRSGSYSNRREQGVLNQQNQFLDTERGSPQRYTEHGVRYIPQTTQQSQNITEQTEDLTQQQTEDLTQHSQNGTQQTEDLTQQTDDLTQHIVDDLLLQLKNLTEQSYLPSQSEDLTHSQVFSQQTQDLTQQSPDFTQQTQDSIQQSQDFSQHQDFTQHSQDLTQQTQDLTRQAQESSQQTHTQTHDLAQQLEDLTQQTYSYRQPVRRPPSAYYVPQQTHNLGQQTEDLTQQTADLTQQTEDLAQQSHVSSQNQDLTQQLEDLQQQTEDLNQHAGYYHQQNGNSHQRYQSQHSYSSSSNSQIHYGTAQETRFDQTDDLEQQHVEEQHANVVQDVSHQAQEVHPQLFGNNEEEEEVTTTKKPGFWKKLGGKITNTYDKAKHSILSIG